MNAERTSGPKPADSFNEPGHRRPSSVTSGLCTGAARCSAAERRPEGPRDGSSLKVRILVPTDHATNGKKLEAGGACAKRIEDCAPWKSTPRPLPLISDER